jgi:hypothetical protein
MMNSMRVWKGCSLPVAYCTTVVVIVTFTWVFADLLLRAPEFFPAWDQRNFYELAKLAQSRVGSILAGEPNSWSLAGWGFAHQYNLLFALPLVPVFTEFGQSWYIYGMAIAVIYGTAATLSVGLIPVVLLANYRPSIVCLTFVFTAVVAATRSAGWYSTIYYYPDIGDAFFLSIWLIGALLLLRRPGWWRTGMLVLLTVAVILFRRALLFAWGALGIGLAIAVAIQFWIDWRKGDLHEKHLQLRAGASRIGYLAASAIIALGILAIPSRSFLKEMLSIVMDNAYADYAHAPKVILDAMLSVMGIIPLGLSAVGYVAGATVFRHRRFEIIGLGLAAVLNMISWVVILRHWSPQNFVVPGVLFLPLGIGLGVGALAEKLRGRKLGAVLGTASLLLLLSAGRLVDGAVSRIMEVGDLSSLPLLQGQVAAVALHRGMERPCKEMFARLEIAGPQPRKVLVVASSVVLNDAVVQSAAEALLGDMAKSYLFLAAPAIDRKDKLMVTELMDADYVLVGNPLQTHLPTGFDGLRVVRDMFVNHEAAAVDFQSLGEPVAFPGFSVSIYRRVRESNEWTALATLDALQAVVAQRGYRQPSWIEIGRLGRGESGAEAPNDAIVAHNRLLGEGWPARYLSYDKMPKGDSIELRGVGETTCPQGTLLTLRAMTPSGAGPNGVATALLPYRTARQPFTLATTASVSGLHLELEINPPSAKAPCDVKLEGLELYFGHHSGS